jgi:hypothetical protein
MRGRILVLAGVLGVVAGAAVAEPAKRNRSTDVSAQGEVRYLRTPPRITVTPGTRLLYRDCEDALVQEFRPSGTVLVPRMRCWWVRG